MFVNNSVVFRFILSCDELGQRVLRHDPKGWEELGSTLARDPKYHGITTEFNEDTATFIKDGKDYVSVVYEQVGVQADITLSVEIYDPNNFAWKPYRRYRLELTAAKETATDFTCGLIQGGFTQRFLNREDTKVDLLGRESVGGSALASLAPTFIELHSRAIVKRYDAKVTATQIPFPDYFVGGDSRSKVMYFGFGNPSSDKEGIDDFEIGEYNTGTVSTPLNSSTAGEVPFYRTKERGLFKIDLNILANIEIQRRDGEGNFDKVDLDIFFRINDEPNTLLYTRRDVGVSGYARDMNAAHQLTRTLNIGDRIYIYGIVYVHDINNPLIGPYRFTVLLKMKAGSYLKIEAETQTLPTQAPGLLVYEALERLAQATTDETDVFRSSFFGRTDTSTPYPIDGPGSLLFVTGGFQLRGFPLEKKSLFATWRDLIEALAAIYNIGVGIETLPNGKEVIVVEALEYFYSDEIALDLTLPAISGTEQLPYTAGPRAVALTIDTQPGEHYNAVEIGYRKWRPGQTNGLEEFNTRHEYALPLTTVSNKYSQVSSYITAGHYIETVRRDRYDITSTEDTSSDDEGFLICLVRGQATGFETERDQQATGPIDNVFSPQTSYNLRLSPKRMLLRHAPTFGAGLIQQQDTRVRFTFGEGNYLLKSQLLGESAPLVENSDVMVNARGNTMIGLPGLIEPLWRPQKYQFNHPLNEEQLEQLLLKPRGRIRFQDEKGQIREGWASEVKHTAVTRTAEFTLRACYRRSSR